MTTNLYWKISATLLGLLAIIGTTYLLITGYTASRYLQETNQRLYGHIADSTVQVVRPLIDGRVDTAAIQDIMHSLMVINPSVEVYLLDTTGQIITYVAPYKRVQLDRVDLGPVRTFIDSEEKPFIRGDDPRHPGQSKVFSAAAIQEDGRLSGYLYIILASEEQAAVAATLSGSYMLRLGARMFFIALVGAMAIGLLAFWLLTRHLRRATQTLRRFQQGDHAARIGPRERGALPVLADTFNDMADTLVANIEAIRSVDNLRQELIANVSHDLRTPLAIMQGYVETLQLKDGELTPAERQRYLDILRRSSEKLSRLIAQLFEYSRLEARQIKPEKEAFSPADLAQDIFQNYQVLAQEKGIDMQLEVEPGLPLVFADIALVERVIQNLMDNALKFTPPDGEVRIVLRATQTSVEIGVGDTGPGIPADQQAYIFERYRKSNGTEGGKGAGLGLAIARKILELHDSSIQVRSRRHEGTEFWFQLPAA